MNNKQKGFSLFELVVFIVITGIVATGLFVGLNATLESEHEIDDTDHALVLAQQRMEVILGQRKQNGFTPFLDPCSAPASFPDELCAVGAFAFGYTVTSTIDNNWNGNSNFKVVTVDVTGPGTASLTTIVGDYDDE
jgi:type II secretory pathway pseudopilin PulG